MGRTTQSRSSVVRFQSEVKGTMSFQDGDLRSERITFSKMTRGKRLLRFIISSLNDYALDAFFVANSPTGST